MTLVKNKLYILIDKNLDPIYGAVQGGHAVAKWLTEHGQIKRQSSGRKYHNVWNNEYLIYLKADLEDIQNNYLELYATKDEETLFLEPDLDNKLTAIAIHESSINNDRLKRKIKKLKLWGT